MKSYINNCLRTVLVQSCQIPVI